METTYKKLYEAVASGLSLKYYLAETRTVTDTGVHPRFGAAIESFPDERAEYPDIFPTRADAEAFLQTLHRNLVTPTTLGDIVYDTICA